MTVGWILGLGRTYCLGPKPSNVRGWRHSRVVSSLFVLLLSLLVLSLSVWVVLVVGSMYPGFDRR